MKQQTLTYIRQFVHQQLKQTPDLIHGWQHAQDVANNAKLLWSLLPPKQAKTIDLNLLQAACYLHDLHTTKYPNSFSNFLFESKLIRQFLPPILNQLPLNPKEKEIIYEAIIHHPLALPFHRLNRRRSLYAQLLQDADILDQFNPKRLQLLKIETHPTLFHRFKTFLVNFNHPNTARWLISHFSNQPNLAIQVYNYNSHSYQYIESGNNQKPTILFLHGYADSAYTFLPTINQLSTQYHLISLELPFHQKRSIYNLNQLLDYISSFLVFKKLHRQKITISGFSLGGLIAAHYAINHPKQINKIIFLNSAPPPSSPLLKFITKLFIPLLKIPFISRFIVIINLRFFAPFRQLQHDYFSKFNLKNFSQSIHQTTLRILKDSFRTKNLLEQLNQLQIPTQAIFFADDQIVPPHKYAPIFTQFNIPVDIFPQGGHANQIHSWNLALTQTLQSHGER